MGLRLQRAVALETLDLCAELRADATRSLRAVIPSPPSLVVLAAIGVAICASRTRSLGKFNPMADLSDAEYKRRYELGRRRYLAERAVRKALRREWLRHHGPWLLLAVIAVLLVVVLGLTQPHRFIVISSLALYSGLAWVVCWAVRASC